MTLLKPRMLALFIGATMLTGCFEKPTASSTYVNSLIKVSAFEVPSQGLIETPVLNFTGRAGVSEEEVRSVIPGVIKRVRVVEGQKVTKGNLLLELDDSALKENMLASEQRYQLAKKNYRSTVRTGHQVKSMVVEGGPGDTLIAQANDLVHAAHGEYVAALASRNNDHVALQASQILAPIDGVLEHLSAIPGATVTQDSPLAVIKPARNQWVEVTLTNEVFYVLGNAKSLASEINLTFVDGSTGIGKIQTPVVINGDQVVVRIGLLKPVTGFLPGDDVQVEIHVEPIDGLVRVPPQALKTNADGHYVFVVGKDDGRADVRQVEVVKWPGSDRFVQSGLKPGDLVVTSNFAKLRPGVRTKVEATDSR